MKKQSDSNKEQAQLIEKPHYYGHRERMKKKLINSPSSLTDYEIFEILLYYIFSRKDTKELAKKLIAQFGNIRNTIFSDINKLKEVEGIGESSISLFILIKEILLRANLEDIKKSPVIASSKQVASYYKNIFCNIKHEQLRIMFLNNKNLLIAEEIFQEGTVNRTAIYLRPILKRAFELGAAAVIMVHNHPSGDPEPSREDIIVTKNLKNIAVQLDIVLLDHLVIGKNKIFSMKEHSII